MRFLKISIPVVYNYVSMILLSNTVRIFFADAAVILLVCFAVIDVYVHLFGLQEHQKPEKTENLYSHVSSLHRSSANHSNVMR
jgi:hypothetical protein